MLGTLARWLRRYKFISSAYERLVRPLIHRRADAVIVMMRGSGSTWLHTLVRRIMSERAGKPFDTPLWRFANRSTPFMYFNTDDGSHHPNEDAEHMLRRYRGKKVVLLVRDPRDIYLSRFHWLRDGRGEIEGDVGRFLQTKHDGARRIVDVLNAWSRHPDLHLIRYEDMRRDTAGAMRGMLDFLGLSDVSDDAIQDAVEYSSLENMAAREREGALYGSKPLDPNNRTTFKARSGSVGGAKESLPPEELEFLTNLLQEQLNAVYDYR